MDSLTTLSQYAIWMRSAPTTFGAVQASPSRGKQSTEFTEEPACSITGDVALEVKIVAFCQVHSTQSNAGDRLRSVMDLSHVCFPGPAPRDLDISSEGEFRWTTPEPGPPKHFGRVAHLPM